jgi:hypothetical protein
MALGEVLRHGVVCLPVLCSLVVMVQRLQAWDRTDVQCRLLVAVEVPRQEDLPVSTRMGVRCHRIALDSPPRLVLSKAVQCLRLVDHLTPTLHDLSPREAPDLRVCRGLQAQAPSGIAATVVLDGQMALRPGHHLVVSPESAAPLKDLSKGNRSRARRRDPVRRYVVQDY